MAKDKTPKQNKIPQLKELIPDTITQSKDVPIKKILGIDKGHEIKPLTDRQINEILITDETFVNIDKTQLTTAQIKDLHKFIEVNYYISKGIGLTESCEIVNLDNRLFYRVLNKYDGLNRYYAQSRENQADYLFSRALYVSQNQENDFYTNKDGVLVPNGVNVQRSRLMWDALKWHAGKLHSKYQDKTTLSGDSDNPLKVVAVSGMVIE